MCINIEEVIEKLTEDIVELYDIETPISDMKNVVAKLGGTVVATDTFQSKLKRDGNGFTIEVPFYTATKKLNYLTARELGHLFLHMGYLTNSDIWEKQKDGEFYKENNIEKIRQANKFAYSLLMPREEYKLFITNNSVNGKINIKKIADYFDVLASVAFERGCLLGYMEEEFF